MFHPFKFQFPSKKLIKELCLITEVYVYIHKHVQDIWHGVPTKVKRADDNDNGDNNNDDDGGDDNDDNYNDIQIHLKTFLIQFEEHECT